MRARSFFAFLILTFCFCGFSSASGKLLECGDHAGYRVVKCGVAVQVRLPELRKQLEVTVPAPLIDAFANRVRSVACGGNLTGSVCCGGDHWADDFSCGVENQRVP